MCLWGKIIKLLTLKYLGWLIRNRLIEGSPEVFKIRDRKLIRRKRCHKPTEEYWIKTEGHIK